MTGFLVLTLSSVALAQQGGRGSFQLQQAYAEMQRVSAQVDVLQSNHDDLVARVGRIEAKDETSALKTEVTSLKAQVAELKAALAKQREDIVRDLSGRISKMQAAAAPAPAAPRQPTVVTGPHIEYVVESGDTLSLIAAAFKTSVRKIKEMNGLKGDMLRVGQKLYLPKED